ncbi:MAG: UV DNA damage repair endonuclease UvsE [Gordonibacter sp.]|nr:UV DNA damage repair endonuclease UvsE [Gordonibacter sp.]
MNIGYASKTLALPEGKMRSITRKHATDDALALVIEHNLEALDAVLDYCADNSIRLFRISSDLIPFGSNPINQLDWVAHFSEKLHTLGTKARTNGIRLSMHPGQYTVLNSPDDSVAERAVVDLAYHASLLDGLGMDTSSKIVLHIGGMYGNRQEAMNRFVTRFLLLPDSIKCRLVIENDDRLFTAKNALSVSRTCGVPMVFDVLHHRLNHEPDSPDELFLLDAAKETWGQKDGRQKIHYSQQAPCKRSGSHSETIILDTFLEFVDFLRDRSPDIMLEVKDKNLSAVKCSIALDPRKKIYSLEREWGRYKYSVLEHDQAIYQEIRTLLKDKESYPVRSFYCLVEEALSKSTSQGSAINAAQHVWGYVSNLVDGREKASFMRTLQRYEKGEVGLDQMKHYLQTLSERYEQTYLTHSYYFAL